MPYLILIVVIVLALAVGAMYLVRPHLRERQRVDEVLADPRTPTLEYAVPTGQDPAVILAALHRAGYTATVDPHGSHQVVIIECPAGVDAERGDVRAVIESADVTAPDDGAPVDAVVRFRDETT